MKKYYDWLTKAGYGGIENGKFCVMVSRKGYTKYENTAMQVQIGYMIQYLLSEGLFLALNPIYEDDKYDHKNIDRYFNHLVDAIVKIENGENLSCGGYTAEEFLTKKFNKKLQEKKDIH
jgi:hypothetical protein